MTSRKRRFYPAQHLLSLKSSHDPLIAAGCSFTNGAARVRARIWLLPAGWVVISSSHEVVSTALTSTPWLATLKFRAHYGDDVLRGMTGSPTMNCEEEFNEMDRAG